MNSGIDLTSTLNRNDKSNEEGRVEKIGSESIANAIKKISKEPKANGINPKESGEEESELLERLEEFSKEKVKGSSLINYFKASKRPFCLIFLALSFLLAQILAGVSDIFVSCW